MILSKQEISRAVNFEMGVLCICIPPPNGDICSIRCPLYYIGYRKGRCLLNFHRRSTPDGNMIPGPLCPNYNPNMLGRKAISNLEEWERWRSDKCQFEGEDI